jgi:hypothetical protein
MSDVEKIFSDDWCGMDVFLEKVLKPIFGDYEKGYHVFTDDREIKQKAREANIEEIKHCATFETIESNLKVYDVTVSDNIKIERNRVHIQSVIRLYIEQVEGALIVFHHKQVENKLWRFSYIEEIKNRKDSSSARRYTYIVGKSKPSRTIRERFDILKTKSGAISMHDLTNAFSVESLTKEFYNEIFGWYNWACEVASFPQGKGRKVTQTRDKNSISLIRLITRIMFVWFIKQKDLIPQWIFNEPELKKILCEFDSESETKSNYYNAILQNLFFATLNKEINLRSFTNDEDTNEHYGIKTFYRDDLKKSFFKISRDEVIKKFESVPFLNGGLFECLDKKDDDGSQDYQDGFSREQNRRAFLPNALFFAREKNGHEGLFHILNKYNFTIEENSPSEVQVALDPELLGNVFENLLGTYNPETSETARKDSGSFYTPREIVSFMVNEALKAHLSARLGADSQKVIDKLFDRNVTEEEFADFAKENKIDTKKIINALKEVKVFDPACGSGAFPTGILQELVSLIKKIDMDSCDTEEKLYELKLSLIENCIFGSDIQPIAIQIAKLRFFITLVCEQEKTQDAKNNYGIKALPNLETKFVVADSLTGIQKPEPDTLGIDDAELSRQKDELWEIRKKHFKAATASEKHLYREQDEQKRKEIVDLLKKQTIRGNEETIANFEKEIKNLEKQIKNLPVEMVEEKIIHLDNSVQISTADSNAEERKNLKKRLSSAEKNLEKEKNKRNSYDSTIILEKLLQWNPYEQNDAADFFDSEWMFGIKDGFDIVIGNPPYVQLQNNGGRLAKLYEKCGFESFNRMGDIYALFYEKAYSLLRSGGLLCFITSNKWMRAGYGENLRNFFAKNVNPRLLVDFAGTKVFESATVDTNILLFEKGRNKGKTISCAASNLKKEGLANLSDFVKQESSICSFTKSDSWVILSPIEQSIKRKIEATGTPLKDWDIQINYGIKTGFNDAFIITEEKRNEILEKCRSKDERTRTAELIRPILRGRDIKRYSYEYADLYLIATFPSKHYDIEKFPAVKAHLLSFGMERLEQTGKEYIVNGEKIKARKKTNNKWFETQDSISYLEEFSKPKIVWGNLNLSATYAFAPKGMMINAPATMIVPASESLLCILNSKLADYYIRNLGVTRNGGYFEYKPMFVGQFCVPKNLDEKQFSVFKNNELQSEEEINRKVYKLYGLTKEEIDFIESQYIQ